MKRRADWVRLASAVCVLLALSGGSAAAYIGPGGGLALLTTALAMLAAFSVSAMVVLTWPIRAMRRWLRRRRARADGDDNDRGERRPAEE